MHAFKFDEIKCSDWQEVRNILYKLENDKHRFWTYRGHANADWNLESSFERLIPNFTHELTIDWNQPYYSSLEMKTIEKFKLGCFHHAEGEWLPKKEDHYFEWLAVLQHHGAKTRFIDITASPFIAAFFALFDVELREKSSCIWAFDSVFLADENKRRLSKNESLMSDDELENLYKRLPFESNEEYDMIASYFSNSPSRRQYVQKSGFIYALNNKYNFEETLATYDTSVSFIKKIIIPAFNDRDYKMILSELKMMNINNTILFPGLDGYTKDIALNTFIEI